MLHQLNSAMCLDRRCCRFDVQFLTIELIHVAKQLMKILMMSIAPQLLCKDYFVSCMLFSVLKSLSGSYLKSLNLVNYRNSIETRALITTHLRPLRDDRGAPYPAWNLAKNSWIHPCVYHINIAMNLCLKADCILMRVASDQVFVIGHHVLSRTGIKHRYKYRYLYLWDELPQSVVVFAFLYAIWTEPRGTSRRFWRAFDSMDIYLVGYASSFVDELTAKLQRRTAKI